MAITLKKKNFAKSTLNSGISDVAVSLTAASGDGSRFPSSGKFRAVLWGASYTNPSDDPNVEIVEAELDTGDTFDITRAHESTSAQAWSASDNFAHVLTAETIEEVGQIVQIVHAQTGAVATGSTQIPHDDTKPQNSEGTEFMTATITPKDAANKLLIEVTAFLAAASATTVTGALFQDSGADAIAVGAERADSANTIVNLKIPHEMVAGTTSATTFKFRAGPAGAVTLTFNGTLGVRRYGGVMASSIRITEYKA